MVPNPYAEETREELIDALMADNSTLWRRANNNLTSEDFAELMRRSRQRLQALRDLEFNEAGAIVLTDAGVAVAAARQLGQKLSDRPVPMGLFRRLGLITGRQLADQPTPNRMRHVQGLGVIDGGRA